MENPEGLQLIAAIIYQDMSELKNEFHLDLTNYH